MKSREVISTEHLRKDLLEIVRAMKSYVLTKKEMNDLSNFSISGDKPVENHNSVENQKNKNEISSAPEFLTLDEVRQELGDCSRCQLCETRKNIVFGEGNPHAELVFVGEAPGGDEDLQGRPFVGRAGQLLTRIIAAMGLEREDVYICNILKCRPPGNRNPKNEEIKICEPFLIKQLLAIQPKVICALGTFAAQTLLKADTPISLLRGTFHSYKGIKLMPTYHPAYLLRNQGAKKKVWDDVQMIMKVLSNER